MATFGVFKCIFILSSNQILPLCSLFS